MRNEWLRFCTGSGEEKYMREGRGRETGIFLALFCCAELACVLLHKIMMAFYARKGG